MSLLDSFKAFLGYSRNIDRNNKNRVRRGPFAVINLPKDSIAWSTLDYNTYAREGYMSNPYAYAAISMIAKAVGGVDWIAYRRTADDKFVKLDRNHRLAKLLRSPNPRSGWARFMETVISYLYVSGNAFIHAISVNNDEYVKELWAIRPDVVSIKVGTVADPVALYIVQSANDKMEIQPKDMLHLKFFNPVDDLYGMSPLQAASRCVDHNNAARAWNYYLLKNSGRPSGAFIAPDMTDNEYEALQRRINEDYSGEERAGAIPILTGDLKWQELSTKPKDVDWLEGMKQSGREIAITLGVPPELLGDIASKTFSNIKIARKVFYENTILPLMDWLRDELNRFLVPKFNEEDLYVDYDINDIEGITEDRADVWGRVNAATFLTRNEKRQAVGYPTREDGDVYDIPVNMRQEELKEK